MLVIYIYIYSLCGSQNLIVKTILINAFIVIKTIYLLNKLDFPLDSRLSPFSHDQYTNLNELKFGMGET